MAFPRISLETLDFLTFFLDTALFCRHHYFLIMNHIDLMTFQLMNLLYFMLSATVYRNVFALFSSAYFV